MNETVLKNENEIDDFVCVLRSEVTFDEVQLVFHELV
jgi:hypothetical protein